MRALIYLNFNSYLVKEVQWSKMDLTSHQQIALIIQPTES